MAKKRRGLQQALIAQQTRTRFEASETARRQKEEQARTSKSKGKERARDVPPKPTIPFRPGQRILLLGEANFAFALSLVKHHMPDSGNLIVATTFDSRELSQAKYDDLESNITELEALGVKVLFDVDAGALDKVKTIKGQRFDAAIFNFPHVGAGEKDQDRNIRLNQVLILRFLRSCAHFLAVGSSHVPSTKKKRKRMEEDEGGSEGLTDEEVPPQSDGPGCIFITLRNASPYTLWNVPLLAKKGPAVAPALLPHPLNRLPPSSQPTYSVVRSFAFPFHAYPGYAHRRTIGFQKGISTEASEDARLPTRFRKDGECAEHAGGGARTFQLALQTS